MLHDLTWLAPGKIFPPAEEAGRITRYRQNAHLFDGDHFADPRMRSRESFGCDAESCVNLYLQCAQRISKVVGNFDEVVSFPVLLNYQRLMTLKMSDLVCGEPPTITGSSAEENEILRALRDFTDFDAKLYSTAIDISRYGDAIWRVYKDYTGFNNFTVWTPTQWYPIVACDGTNTVIAHCLCWIENRSEDSINPKYVLCVQIHGCQPKDLGKYERREYAMDSKHTIGQLYLQEEVSTGLNVCAVQQLKAFTVSNTVYGYDDYMPVDSLLAEIMVRVGQISAILDKHADPNITGPVSLLKMDSKTGEYRLETGRFFGISPGETEPKYLTWDGQLSSAFKQLEFLVNQLYIISEMGSAVLGGVDNGSQAVSGTAMRFKMVNPLAKARRVANSMTKPIRVLLSCLSQRVDLSETDVQKPAKAIRAGRISVFWSDGLPDDPRENVEIAKLATGETRMMPLEKAIMEYFNRSNEEARSWIKMLQDQAAQEQLAGDAADPNHPGPQDGTGVNSSKKGSSTGLNDFHGLNNADGKEDKE